MREREREIFEHGLVRDERKREREREILTVTSFSISTHCIIVFESNSVKGCCTFFVNRYANYSSNKNDIRY